ncbi:hypothetical protein AQUCO_09100021v1 [Aquilegia coerulea]|uniref:non-specific serine/threonine protein kinase n=1 Tax=Aquilegia coerulea TaxID=218851 RepID=A0A2G5C5N6_AQUCA|nr:hypothetical protein AQUCO_09100021v1 [Aquilegia coerulea]
MDVNNTSRSEDSSLDLVEKFLSALGPKPYSLEDLENFTSNFSKSNKVGSGGYGEVYRGQFPGGVQVAIKVLTQKDVIEESFMAEVSTMGKAYHRNLVKLYGYCFERNMKALVYEYMENGSLDKILYENSFGCIEWEKLYNIAIGTAKGLLYLHDGWDEQIIHYDIKASNILLDRNLCPKITDFGLAKLLNRDESHVPLTRIRGTIGYNAPETWMPGSQVTYKCDVYSFGMMLFEVLGKRSNGMGENWFPAQVWEKFEKGQLEHVLRDCGITKKDSEKAKILSLVALWCAQYTPEIRPSMIDVVLMLEKRIPVGRPPYPFQFRQSSNSSVPPSVLETVPEVYSKDHERIKEKVTNIVSENPVLPQHSVVLSSSGEDLASEPTHTIFEKTEKGQNEESRDISENQDLLIKCISQDLGFSAGRPVTSCLIYKCLLHWKSFEDEKTNLFDRIIQEIGSAIQYYTLMSMLLMYLRFTLLKVHDNNDSLSYWLSNASTLVFLLQHTLKASGALSSTPQQRRMASTSLFGRMTQGLRGPPLNTGISFLNGRIRGEVDDSRHFEAKYPALLFKQQLTAFLEKIYALIRDKLKKEISPMLGFCIQVPRTSRASLVKGSRSQQDLLVHWGSIVKILNNYLKTLRENYVPPLIVRQLFTQIFSFVNVQLFNSVLLRRECCSFSNGEFIKHGLAELENWCFTATEEVIYQKPKKTFKEITNDLCPVLSVQQLYRITTMYWDDKYGTHSVSPEVISSMRVVMTEESNIAVSSSFLLDDNSRIPFSLDDISKSIQQIDIADIDPPSFLRENSEFHFLLQLEE